MVAINETKEGTTTGSINESNASDLDQLVPFNSTNNNTTIIPSNATTMEDNISSDDNNDIRRGFELRDNAGNYIFDIENCSNIANSSEINGLSECEFAEYETAKERNLTETSNKCDVVLPDGFCVTGSESIEEDLDDAPKFNEIIGYSNNGFPIYYCTASVIIVGMPCSPLESEEERQRNEEEREKKPTLNETNYNEWGFANCPPKVACVDSSSDDNSSSINKNNKSEITTENKILLPAIEEEGKEEGPEPSPQNNDDDDDEDSNNDNQVVPNNNNNTAEEEEEEDQG